jgi:guanylate kinase
MYDDSPLKSLQFLNFPRILFSVTSRPIGEYEVDGEACWFVAQDRMLKGVEDNEFLDIGEHDSYMYGTTFASVRDVMAENKLCIIDCKPEVGTARDKKH